MHRSVACAASVAVLLAATPRLRAEPPVFVPCNDLPAAVAALASKSEIDWFGIAPSASVAVVAVASPGEATRSSLRFARHGEEPRSVQLSGRVFGLAVASDGSLAYAVVRVADRKGVVRSVELVRVDLGTARATSGATLPATAGGLAIAPDGSTVLVACRDEIRTFLLPSLASGPLYRVPGDNVGVAPLAHSSYVLVAQRSRVALADLAAPQGRDGLVLAEEAAAAAPLRGMVTSTGDAGPLAVSDDGLAWCLRLGALPQPAAPAPQQPAPAAPVVAPAPVDPAPPDPAPPADAEAPAAPAPPVVPAPRLGPTEPGTVFGVVTGPALAEVAAIVLLGPDNVLREAARAVPDDQGRFSASALPAGAYRIVAAGRGGRVLICSPPFVTIRLGSNGAVEAPVLNVLRAQ